MTRRALIEERHLEALRVRCADIGVRLILDVDCDGEAAVVVGAERFDEWDFALAHVTKLEASQGSA
jgi:hypothetical protein